MRICSISVNLSIFIFFHVCLFTYLAFQVSKEEAKLKTWIQRNRKNSRKRRRSSGKSSKFVVLTLLTKHFTLNEAGVKMLSSMFSQYEGEINVLYQVSVAATLTNKKWGGKELSLKPGEKLDVIVKAVDDKLICRNEDGKCEHPWKSQLMSIYTMISNPLRFWIISSLKSVFYSWLRFNRSHYGVSATITHALKETHTSVSNVCMSKLTGFICQQWWRNIWRHWRRGYVHVTFKEIVELVCFFYLLHLFFRLHLWQRLRGILLWHIFFKTVHSCVIYCV